MPYLADKQGMTWTLLAERFQEWTAEIRQSLEMDKSEPMATDSQEWYTGLAVSPASFSRQLVDMQISLKQVSVAGSGRAVAEEMAVGSQRSGN